VGRIAAAKHDRHGVVHGGAEGRGELEPHPGRNPRRHLPARLQPARGAFTQSYGADELDAAVLMMPLVGFLPALDPRIVSTIERIESELLVDVLCCVTRRHFRAR